MAKQAVIGVTIPANEALSGEIDLGSHRFVAIEMPEAFNGTTLTFQAKALHVQGSTTSDQEDWDNVFDDAGTELSVTVGPNQVVGLKADKASVLAALRYIRLRSGTSAAPVNQNPAREFRIIVKEA